jgi:hypothetical protein
MMKKIKINGMRLNKNYVQVTQEVVDGQDKDCIIPLYQILSSKGINMVSMALDTMGNGSFISGIITLKRFCQLDHSNEFLAEHPIVCTLSIYPHHYKLQALGSFLRVLGNHKLPFQHLVSSNAMLTFVVDQANCNFVIDILSHNFDLPESCTPFEQEENIELTQFLKKKYPETRATYVEEKIKTYGISLVPDLILCDYLFSFDQLAEFGKHLQSSQDKFFHTSAYRTTPGQTHLFLLTKKAMGVPARQRAGAELLNFHGPHFGDRHSIINRALNCLCEKSIPVLHAGCTGASIGIILAKDAGKEAKKALKNVFEIP